MNYIGKSDNFSNNRNIIEQVIVSIITALFISAAILILSNMSFSYLIIFFIGIIIFWIIVITKKIKEFLIIILILSMTFHIDITFGWKKYIGGVSGLTLGIQDFAIFTFLGYIVFERVKSKKNQRMLPKNIIFCLVILLLFSTLSIIKSVDKLLSLYEIIQIFKMILLFYVIVWFFLNCGTIPDYVIWTIVIAVFIEATISIGQFITHSNLGLTVLGARAETKEMFLQWSSDVQRISGTQGQPNGLGWYFAVFLPVVLSFIFSDKSNLLRSISGLTFLLGMVALIISFSRGGWIAFIISSLLFFYFNMRRIPLLKRFLLTSFVTTFIFFLIISIASIDNPIKRRITESDKGAAYSRIPLMRVALNMVLKNPILGVGINNYVLVDQNYDNTPEKITEDFHYTVHNVYIYIASEIGLCAFLGFVGFIIIFYYLSIKQYKFRLTNPSIILGIITGMTGFLIAGNVNTATIGNSYFLPFWFLSGVNVGLYQSNFNR